MVSDYRDNRCQNDKRGEKMEVIEMEKRADVKDTKSLIAGHQVLLHIARKTMASAVGLGLNRH